MSDIQTISIVLAGIGIFIAAMNSIYSSREARQQRQTEIETRQIDTYMRTVGRLDMRDYVEVVYRQEWTDYDDWLEKFGPRTNPQAFASLWSLLRYYRNLGVLAKRNIIDIGLMYDQLSGTSYRAWDKVEPLTRVWRERGSPKALEYFELLIDQLKQYEQQHESASPYASVLLR